MKQNSLETNVNVKLFILGCNQITIIAITLFFFGPNQMFTLQHILLFLFVFTITSEAGLETKCYVDAQATCLLDRILVAFLVV